MIELTNSSHMTMVNIAHKLISLLDEHGLNQDITDEFKNFGPFHLSYGSIAYKIKLLVITSGTA
jgi:hypothetical protein